MPSKNEPLIIGIFGSNGKSSIANLLSSIFNNASLHIEIINDKKNDTNTRNMANIVKIKQLKILPNNDIIIIEINESTLLSDELQKIDFNILIHSHISDDSYENSVEGREKINALMSSDRNIIKTLILNTDDSNWKNIIVNPEITCLIAYGLGSKATVTASSIECSRETQFCYCLQRSLTSFSNEIIEPMEIPVLLNVFGQYNVYNSLAAITAALVCGMDAEIIKSSLSEVNTNDNGIKMLYEDGFAVIDNVCDNYTGFETGFEAIQYLAYGNIYLVCDFDSYAVNHMGRRFVELLSVWCATLKIKKIYCLIASQSYKTREFINVLGSNLSSLGTKFEFLEEDNLNIEGIVNFLQENDMLLFFCSSKLNYIREKITEILDKRILGNITGDAD